MNKKTNDALRNQFLSIVSQILAEKGEDVLRVKANEIAIPTVDADGEDNWVVITVKVPTGSRDGDAYDGYGEAESYQMKVKEKAEKEAEKAKKAEKSKAKKKEADAE
jgi:hypothetical protein